MEVIELIRNAAWYVGVLEQVDAYLNDDEWEGQGYTQDLLRAFNNVENHLALEYFPLIEKEGFWLEDEDLFFDGFSNQVVHIINVYNDKGEKQDYQVFHKLPYGHE